MRKQDSPTVVIDNNRRMVKNLFFSFYQVETQDSVFSGPVTGLKTTDLLNLFLTIKLTVG